jgi:DNA polymerase/3'-5' exonuclease PolX
MELQRAQQIASQVKDHLAPACERIEIAGSIRRRRPFVNDIDIVAIPSTPGQFIAALCALGPFKVGGQKLLRVNYHPIDLDVYVSTPETWATLLLIRTGSAAHNIGMCKLARQEGMYLHADGTGLFKANNPNPIRENSDWQRIAGDTEESIFAALGLQYKKPEEREVG